MDLHPLPLAPTVSALRSGALDLHAHIDDLCGRIERDDTRLASLLPEPDRRARLHRDADALLARWPDAAARPPLFGAAVGVKDIFHVDGFVTRAGTAVPPDLFAGPEAQVVRRLRAAGALILGKTVTTEFAYFEPGPTRNPHNLEHTPGGSSSGSAAAVAAGFSPLALGTQTIGSVIRPAAFCGIVGYKPSLHRIPSAGLVYFSPTMDHVGLFTQDAAGMALAAGALLDGWQGLSAARAPRLAIPEGAYLRQVEAEGADGFARACARLRHAGVALEVVPLFEEIEGLNARHRSLVFGEFARRHEALFAQHGDLYRPRTREIALSGREVSDAQLDDLRAAALGLRAEIDALMQQAGIDLWITPAAPGGAPAGIHATGNPNLNLPWTHTGQPALTLPAGRTPKGLPLGVQLVGRFGADEELLAWAVALEDAVREA